MRLLVVPQQTYYALRQSGGSCSATTRCIGSSCRPSSFCLRQLGRPLQCRASSAWRALHVLRHLEIYGHVACECSVVFRSLDVSIPSKSPPSPVLLTDAVSLAKLSANQLSKAWLVLTWQPGQLAVRKELIEAWLSRCSVVCSNPVFSVASSFSIFQQYQPRPWPTVTAMGFPAQGPVIFLVASSFP